MDDPIDPREADEAEVAAIRQAASEIAQDAEVPDFSDFFLQRHPRFTVFPPIGWVPASEVHEALFETLSAYSREVRAVVWGKRAETEVPAP